MTILYPDEDYNQIRWALDTTLTAEQLTNEVIAMPIYQGLAEIEVKERDTGWASRTGDDLTKLRAAAIFLTASKIAPSLPQILRGKIDGIDYQRVITNAASRAAQLRQEADDLLAEILGEGTAQPFTFGYARGGRART